MIQSYDEFKGCIRKKKYYYLRDTWGELKRLRNQSDQPEAIVAYRCYYAFGQDRHYHIGHSYPGWEKNVIDDAIILSDIRQEETRLFKIRRR